MALTLWGLLALSACTAPVEAPDPELALVCLPSTFALKKLDLAEASGAAWVQSAAGEGWLVVADNGNGGEAVLVGPGGEIFAELKLPLDAAAGDDIEGLAGWGGGRLVGLTSGGFLRQWSLEQAAPQLVQLAKPISADPQWVCQPQETNCGPNWEGLCLDPAPEAGGCAGFALSKALGELVCLREDLGGLVLDDSVRIKVSKKKSLSGCDYGLEAPHPLVVVGNEASDNAFWQILGHRTPQSAQVEPMEIGGTLNQEAVAFGKGGLLLSFGDEEEVTGEGSAIAAFFCQ